jgi:tetratricopeptide (TPR) repeat protein
MVIIISLILIFISLFIILAIVIKKFPALAILDVNNISKEKEAKFKDMIIENKIERDLAKWSGIFGRFFLRLNFYFSKIIEKAHENLKKMKFNYTTLEKLPYQKKRKRLKHLILIAKELIKAESFNKAEDKLVEIISLDQKNLWAFFELGGVYEELRKYPEARQTYNYSLKLARQAQKEDGDLIDVNPQEIYFSLALLEKKAGNIEAAYDNILEALELEPNSPRYLDLILDLSIIKKDKLLAWRYLDKLTKANPENKKLSERRLEIEKIEDTFDENI